MKQSKTITVVLRHLFLAVASLPRAPHLERLPFFFPYLYPFLSGPLGPFPFEVPWTRIRASRLGYAPACNEKLDIVEKKVVDRYILCSLLWARFFSDKVVVCEYFFRRGSFGRVILKDLRHQI